jgi:Eco29kI restriction endonuclease
MERMSGLRRNWRKWQKEADEIGYAPYDPLSRVNLGRSVETALLTQPMASLTAVPPFWGSGIYAVYYVGPAIGPEDLYEPLVGSPAPLYVGRAVPKGARRGAFEDDSRTDTLWKRLDDHRESIDQTDDLDPTRFACRWLVSDQLFVPMAESLMITTYRPAWNVGASGFGNHDPGKGRYEQARSQWDTLHPGRYWAQRLAEPAYDRMSVRAAIKGHLQAYPPDRAPAMPPILLPGTEFLLPSEDDE